MGSSLTLVGLVGLVALGGCAVVGPDYQAPALIQPSAWRTVLPHGGSVATLRGWWSRFDDPAVARLVDWAEDESPTVATAAAQIDAARATQVSARAAGLPALTGVASADRARTALGNTALVANTASAGLDASWEIDLFGKLRRGREAAAARTTARLADWHDARISVAAEVADDYVRYRGCRLLEAAYVGEVDSQRETLRMTQTLVGAGLSAPSDLDLAEASLASAESTLVAQQADCESDVKALVALTGMDEPTLRPVIDASRSMLPTPAVFDVTSLPVDLLRQRPDIASAERALAAASAEIGEAEADRYPSLSLTGAIAIGKTSGSTSAASWSIGPGLTLPIFDAGQRRAAVDTARAAYDVAYATYRSSLRTAVKEVEQALVTLQGASMRSATAQTASTRYRRYFVATQAHWRSGGASLLTLEEARRSSIVADRDYIGIERDHVLAWIALYKALGGGWSVETNDDTARVALKGNSR